MGLRGAATLDTEEVELALGLTTNSPGRSALREICLFLLNNPDKISQRAMAPHIFKVLRQFVADNPPRSSSSKAIALMVDWYVNGGDGMELTEARRCVAKSTGKSLDAVKRAHNRFGSKYEA